MDGYSVKDAAVVLGIPERRVWELLARGVLAGAPEGPDGMIVYLQPKGGPSSVAPSQDASAAGPAPTGAKANGNGGSGELSPFRELLTEFRNLTERYGQALLALGEARGEVASLRTRVELLEARVDLRLPSPPPASTVTWEIPEFAPQEGVAAPAFEADGADGADAADAADAALQEQATEARQEAAEAEDILAGEDEPAAEPMIDLIEESAIAEALDAEAELTAEPSVAEAPIFESPAGEAVPPDAAIDEHEPEVVAGEVEMPEAEAPEAEAPEAIEAAAVESEAVQPEPAPGATLPEPEGETEAIPKPPRRRSRRGRTATAGFAAALARADDPTAAELPGAEETAAALAALQRDIDASRTAERPADADVPPMEPEAVAEPDFEAFAEAQPEAIAEPQPEAVTEEPEPPLAEAPVIEEVAVAAAGEEAAVAEEVEEPTMAAEAEAEAEAARPEPEADVEAQATDEPSAVSGEAPPTEVPTTGPEAAEPPPATVPSYYSTDVVEPDWFADGDFSWLEAAQAEAERVQAAQPEDREASPEPAAEAAEASVQEEARDAETSEADENLEPGVRLDAEPEPPDVPPASDGGEMSRVAIDVGEGESGVAAELAFGDHPATDATPPDMGHEGFEPTVESQAMAEEEARAAIQDAFEEPPVAAGEGLPEEAGPAVAVATAVTEPKATPAPEISDELEAAPDESEATDEHEEPVLAEGIDTDEAADDQAVDDQAAEAPTLEAAAEQPVDSPAEGGVDKQHEVDEEHGGEVEAEAIQEAFEEPMPAPEWQVATDEPAPGDEPASRTDETPRASDDSPRTMAAAAAAETFHGPEEFIAPPAPVVMPALETAPPPAQPSTAAGEEELMWLGDEFEEADLEVAAQGWRSPDNAPAASATAPPVLELSDAELAQLAEDEGWDLDEVEAIRRLLGRPSDAPPAEAPAARQPNPGGEAGPPSGLARPASPSAAGSRPPSSATSTGPDRVDDQEEDPEWLQGRSGAAAEAYRRLRKLFPS